MEVEREFQSLKIARRSYISKMQHLKERIDPYILKRRDYSDAWRGGDHRCSGPVLKILLYEAKREYQSLVVIGINEFANALIGFVFNLTSKGCRKYI